MTSRRPYARCRRSRSVRRRRKQGRKFAERLVRSPFVSRRWTEVASPIEISLPRNLTARKKEASMGRVVVTEFISLDGVIQAPGDPSEYDRGGWATGGGQEGTQFKFDELMAS